MINYYDCSINAISNKLHDIESLGPKENDIMLDLYKSSNDFGFNRVYDYKLADVIITNTFYTEEILKTDIPKIKRMDGIYWKNELLFKNKLHIDAAKKSDVVVFISNYSRNSLKTLYNIEFENSIVILNNAPDFNYNIHKPNLDNFKWVSSCSNWKRYDKRLDVIVNMSKILCKDTFYLIGQCDYELPKNIIKCGYIEEREDMCNILNACDAFVSPYFRDAGSKVTCQAVKCGLPILYTSSGGLPELVNNNGVMINDYDTIDFRDDVPELNIDNVILSANKLKNEYFTIYKNGREEYKKTLGEYFNIMKHLYILKKNKKYERQKTHN